ncbi:MAG: DJ-1/PfpI family protein, partial [Hyphomonadaceae bacterium]|nr:DJ-1/PfpI family protein [Hyphomonadaceae bacterium]
MTQPPEPSLPASQQTHVIVVVPPRVLLLDIAGPIEVLRVAGQMDAGVAYRISFVAPDPDLVSSVGLTLGCLEPLPDHISEGAIVLVPGSADSDPADCGRCSAEAEQEARIVAWLRQVVQPGIRLITICSGALLAGRAGLLDGHSCTTHHESIAEL